MQDILCNCDFKCFPKAPSFPCAFFHRRKPLFTNVFSSQVSEERSEYSLNSEMALISDKTLGETFMGLTSVHKNWLPQLMHFPSRENYGNLENFGGTVLLFVYLEKGKQAVVRSQPETFFSGLTVSDSPGIPLCFVFTSVIYLVLAQLPTCKIDWWINFRSTHSGRPMSSNQNSWSIHRTGKANTSVACVKTHPHLRFLIFRSTNKCNISRCIWSRKPCTTFRWSD